MSEVTTHLRQVVGYVSPEMKAEIEQMVEANRGLSQSGIVMDALEFSWEELKRKYAKFNPPTNGRPGRRRSKAA